MHDVRLRGRAGLDSDAGGASGSVWSTTVLPATITLPRAVRPLSSFSKTMFAVSGASVVEPTSVAVPPAALSTSMPRVLRKLELRWIVAAPGSRNLEAEAGVVARRVLDDLG